MRDGNSVRARPWLAALEFLAEAEQSFEKLRSRNPQQLMQEGCCAVGLQVLDTLCTPMTPLLHPYDIPMSCLLHPYDTPTTPLSHPYSTPMTPL